MFRPFLALFALLAVSGSASAYDGISDNICERTLEDTQKLAFDATARLDIPNHGGWQNGGICWWHSRLFRASLYLTTFRPDLKKPTPDEAMDIINSLIGMNKVVVIPGYSQFAQFTADNAAAIAARLGRWQTEEFFTGFNWVRANKGSSDVSPDALQAIVENIHEIVNEEHRILFERTKIAGQTTNHAWLIIGSLKTDNGYNLQIADSNYAKVTRVIEYHFGDTHLNDGKSTWTQVPYLAFEGEMVKILKVVDRHCGRR